MNMKLFLMLILSRSLNDFCDGCDAGYYGESCSKVCQNFCHDKECNVTSGKCLSCMKGYYSDHEKNCILCPAHCAACNSYKFCFACKTGYRGEVCNETCANCKPDTSCDKNTGYCFENCGEGRSGELCDIKCNSKCRSCDRHNKDECISCADGHRTEKTCNQTDRVCVITCKELTESELQSDKQGSSIPKENIGFIVGAVIGSFIAVIIVCVTVFIIVRRRSTERRNRWFGDKNRTPVKNDDENYELLPREASRIIETRELPSAKKLTVLQMKETFIAIQEKFSDMKIKVAENKVTVEGDPLDIENAFKEINSEYDQIEHLQCQHSKSREWLQFFEKPQTVEYVTQKLKQKQLLGNWDINGTELNVFVHGKGKSVDFKNTLLESVLEISDKKKVNTSLLSSDWWGEFLIDIRTTFNEKVVIFTHEHQDMVIICTDDVVKQVTKMVSEFLEAITDAIQCEPGVCEFVSKFWTQDDFDDIRKNGVKIKTEANKIWLRGLRENVDKGKEKLNMKLKDICCKQVLKRTGITTVLGAIKQSKTISDIEMDYRCVMKFQQEIDERPSVMFDDYEVIDSQLLQEKHQESCTNTSTICFQTRRHNIKIQLIQEDIVHQKVDIIVVGAASNLDLQSGSALDSSQEQGDPKLKTEYNRRYPNGIQNGEVAVIDSGHFKCDKIYSTSLPPWTEASRNGGKVLRNFMRECLRLALNYDKKTIAFSIKVTWEKLGYPLDRVVSTVYGAVAEFDSSYSKTSLKEINIVDDEETIKTCIMCHLKKQERENRTERNFIEDGTILTKLFEDPKYRMVKDGCAIGPIHLHIQIGDLLNCTTDAIVVEVSANIDSKKDSAGLKAKHVISVLSEDTLAGWRNTLVCCLEEAGKKEYNSVALPLFGSGTGTITFLPDGIGACLFAAIDDFTSQNPTSSVTDVRLVVPDSNAGCVPAIIAALQDRTTAVNSRWGIGKIFKSQLGFLEHNNFKESFVAVYSDATMELERCIKALEDRIGLEFATKVVNVDIDVIGRLKDKKINSIIKSDIVVDVMVNKKAGQFTISGPLLNVRVAVACLQNKMQQYTRKEDNHKSAKALYNQTRWHWLSENQKASDEAVPYDMMTNFTIETAYKEKKQTVELQSKDGKIYVIDFQKLVEYPKFNVYDTVMVSRRKFEKNFFKKSFKIK